jgi:hypothetical protein
MTKAPGILRPKRRGEEEERKRAIQYGIFFGPLSS